MSVLVLNAGSASLKFAAFDPGVRDPVARGSLDWARPGWPRARLRAVAGQRTLVDEEVVLETAEDASRRAVGCLSAHCRFEAVGHRVVHGGEHYREACLIDTEVEARLQELSRLAPLHNPPAVAGIRGARIALPDTPRVAVFDTAFFSGLPRRAHVYPVPWDWYVRHGIRRYGFHGISNAYCLDQAAVLLDRPTTSFRLVTCHLGSGCSVTAVNRGQPVATTMGFTPLEGLMMGTRPGSVDAGLLLHMLHQPGMTVDRLERALQQESGLLGVSGISSDHATLETAAKNGSDRARLALDLFADRVRGAIGSLAVLMDGLDVLVFTAGIGEGSPELRAEVCAGLRCLGVRVDPARNLAVTSDIDVASADSAVRVLVLRTREDWVIARETTRVVGC